MLDVDIDNAADIFLGLFCCDLLPCGFLDDALDKAHNANDILETHGGALGWHLLVLTSERVRIDPIVRDPKPDGVIKSRADSTAV